MKKHNHITTLILATLTLTANAQEQLCGTDKQDLTEQVYSVVFGKSEMEITADGTQATQKFASKTSIISKELDNHNIVLSTDANGKPKACISIENAYGPYLNHLKTLVRDLKADEKSCKGINETYKSIYELERVLNNPKLTNTQIQTEYQALKKEYQPDDRSGIYLEINENIFGEKSNILDHKLREILTQNNCRLEQNKCKTIGGYTLKINATTEDYKIPNFKYCKAIVKADLLNSKKQIFSPTIEEKLFPIGKVPKPTACEKAIESSAAEIFSKIRDRIGEVCE